MSVLSQEQLDQLIGQQAPKAYRCLLLADQNISVCKVLKYETPPSLQKRVEIKEFEETIIQQALVIRENIKIPFWEAVFSACVISGKCSKALLEATFYRNKQGESYEFNRKDIESGILEDMTRDNASNLGLCSKVFGVDGRDYNFSFLDFHCDVIDSNKKIVHDVCRHLMPQGFVVLDSGDSYHASSIYLMSNEERIYTLGKAIRVSPIIDSIYIAHQLQQDFSSIRISLGGKAKKIPIVVDAWCPG